MKRIFITIVIMLITLISCKDEGKKINSNDKKQLVSNDSIINKDSYQPGPDWTLAWSDEFDQDVINSNNWNMQVLEAGRFNDEWQRYTNHTKNAYIKNDCLVIKAIHESDTHGKDQYSSARLHTANKQSFKYGKITARIKLPKGKGIWPAFWMLGSNIDEAGGDTPWPQSGEIDILELYGTKNDSVVEGNIHYADSSNKHAMLEAPSYKLKDGKFADAFHIFEIEWDENKITWLVDGEQFATTPITADELSEFHKEFYILLNLAIGGTHAGRPDTTTQFPQLMYIDWVRVYKKSEKL